MNAVKIQCEMLYVCVYVWVRVSVRIYKHMLSALTLDCMYICIVYV